MNIIEEYKTELVTLRALHLLFYNFRQIDIEILCRDEEFKYNWDNLLQKRKGAFLLSQDFYFMFSSDFSREGQAKIIEHALIRYKEEATESIQWSIEKLDNKNAD